jgi:hypothetical protein
MPDKAHKSGAAAGPGTAGDVLFQPIDRKLGRLAAALFAALLLVYAHYRQMGWIVLVAIYVPIAIETGIRRRPDLFVTISALVMLHQLVAVFNLYGHTLPGAYTDARSFLTYAANRDLGDIRPGISVDLYRNFLIVLVHIQEGSRALAMSSSVLAFSLTLLIFNRLITVSGIERMRIPLLLVLGLMPHVLVYTSITLREPWQLLFFVGAVYYGISFRSERRLSDALLFFLCALCLGILHQVLIPLSILLASVILVWPAGAVSVTKTLLRAAASLAVVATVAAACLYVMDAGKFTGVGMVLKMAEFDADYFMQQIDAYRRNIELERPRTAFDVDVDFRSLASLALSMPALYLNYWFSPFPWQVENARDVVAALLALLRGLLIALTAVGFCVDRGDNKLQGLYTVLFVLMCSTWVLGTTNYGQAIRHQVLSDWLLLLVSGGFAERWLARRSPGPDQQPQAESDHGHGEHLPHGQPAPRQVSQVRVRLPDELDRKSERAVAQQKQT